MSRSAKKYIKLWSMLLLFIVIGGSSLCFVFLYTWPEQASGIGILLLKGEIGQVLSPKDGTIERWLMEEGHEIHTGEPLLILRSYKNPFEQSSVMAPASGYLAEIIAYPGSTVNAGDSLALITASGDRRKDLELIGFVSSLDGKKLAPGMRAYVWPSVTDRHKDGALLAEVKRVGMLPTSKAALKSLVKIPELAKYLRNSLQGEPFLVVLTLLPDEKNVSGYAWNGPGPSFLLDYGIIADFSITYAEPSLINALLPWRMGK
jgi:hypothetical protein